MDQYNIPEPDSKQVRHIELYVVYKIWPWPEFDHKREQNENRHKEDWSDQRRDPMNGRGLATKTPQQDRHKGYVGHPSSNAGRCYERRELGEDAPGWRYM